MRNRARVVLFLLMFVLLVVPVVAAQEEFDYEHGIHLIRPESHFIQGVYPTPEYLSLESLVFVSCVPGDALVTNSILCEENNNFKDLEAVQWGNEGNCYLSAFDLEDFSCTDVRLQAEYEQDGETFRYYKDLHRNKFSTLLDEIVNSQYSDGGWRSARDTAYGIWGISQFPKNFQYGIEEALDWLKVERDEFEKCWPDSNCDASLTLEILYTLYRSGVDEARRAVHDARNWIENKQSFYEPGDEWSVTIEPYRPRTLFLLAAVDNTLLDRNFTISNESRTYSFEVGMDKTLYVASHANFEAQVADAYGRRMLKYQGSNLSYDFPGPCWSQSERGEPCDHLASAYGAMLDLHKRNKVQAKRWMFSQINYSDTVGAYYGEGDNAVETALFLSMLHNDTVDNQLEHYSPYMERYGYLSTQEQYKRHVDEFIDWLLFKQNNEGYWGEENSSVAEKALPTAYAVMSLKHAGYNRSFEPIHDAERWISDHEEEIPENDTAALASAFYVVRHNARPLLNPKPSIVRLNEDKTEVELYNPTMFDLRELEYSFTHGLGEYLSVDERQKISAYSYRGISIIQNESAPDDLYGFLVVSNYDDPIAKIPVLTTDYASINVSVSDSVQVFGTKGKFSLDVKKSEHTFSCSMNWDSSEISSPGTFKIGGSSAQVSFRFAKPQSKEQMYEGTLKCAAADNTFNLPLEVYMERYKSAPFVLTPQRLTVNSSGEKNTFQIRNELDSIISPTITLKGSGSEYFDTLSSVTLNPNERRNITISSDSLQRNLSTTFQVEVSAMDVDRRLAVHTSILQEQEGGGILLWIVFAAIVTSIGGLAAIAYYYRKEIREYLNKFSTVQLKKDLEKQVSELQNLREDEKANSIQNMVDILRVQKKSDDEIKNTMLSYFSEEDLKKAVQQGNVSIPGFEQYTQQ